MPAILLLIALLAAGYMETGEACKEKMDLCFFIDGSSTVCGGNEPCQNWKSVLQFSKSITNTLDIGPTMNRVALATFFNKTEVKWDLNQYTAMSPLLTAIDQVAFKGGVFTDLLSALELVTQVFNPVTELIEGRFDVENVLLLITDSVPSIDDLLAQAMSLVVQQTQVTVFVVCIRRGSECDDAWAKAIASKPSKPGLKTYFIVDSYSSLDNALRDIVMEQICYFLDPSYSNPLVNLNVDVAVG